jgi:hypothetical protein
VNDLEEILPPIFFFLMVFGIVAVSMWRKFSTERERQATVRMAIERGQQLDAALVEKMLTPTVPPKPSNPVVVPFVLISAGVGFAVFGFFMRQIEDEAFWPLVGIGSMVAIIGTGLLIAVLYGRRWIGARE